MARNREKKGSLLHQVKTALDEKLAIGESKFEDKKIGATADKIYSWNTYKTYLKHNIYFIQWAKENMHLSNLDNNKIRFIVDDVIKFLEREKRRGRTYHGIIMDPPSYGRGPNKEVWRLEDNLKKLLDKTKDILDPNYSFLLINSYTTGVSPISLNNLLSLTFNNANVETGEIGLPVTKNNLILPCGIYGKVTRK